MKKIFILIIIVLVSANSFAQRSSHKYAQPVNIAIAGTNADAKTTHTGDTYKLSNIAAGDTALVVYSAGADSGYLTGTDYWEDQAFAERYDFNGADSSMKVIGLFAQFGGKVNPASAHNVSFNVWSAGAKQYITSELFYSGLPNTVLTTHTVPVTQLGIGAAKDTMKQFMFDSATAFLSGPFFIGYSMNYNFSSLAGDTIGLVSSKDGHRTSPKTTQQVIITDVDTIVNTLINVQNATQWSDNNWHDNYSDNDSLFNDLAIFPIVVIGTPTGVKGVTRSNLTFYGNYPNPAVNSTNIKFSLAMNADVTIDIIGMNGRTLKTITQTNLVAGEHIIPVNTSALPAGDYLYLIRTSGGDGIASKMTVIR